MHLVSFSHERVHQPVPVVSGLDFDADNCILVWREQTPAVTPYIDQLDAQARLPIATLK